VAENWTSVAEAAERLGVTERRVRDYIANGTLHTRTVSGVHLVSGPSLDQLVRTRLSGPGAPLSAAGAWRRIAAAASSDGTPGSRHELDRFRRAVRSRAQHSRYYVHPALLGTAASWPGSVRSGQQAAAAAGAAVDPDTASVELYVPTSVASELLEQVRARVVIDPSDRANLVLHIVPDKTWPFSPSASIVPGWVAWLDLADVDDRASDALLDRLLGGRLVD
jgi:hypothetical protein